MTPWVVRGGMRDDYRVLARDSGALIGSVSYDRWAPQKERWRAVNAETLLGSFPRLRDAAAFLWERHRRREVMPR